MRPVLVVAALLLVTGCGPSGPQEGTVAALPGGACRAQHVNPADPQAWEPDVGCTPGAIDGGLMLAQLCPVAHTAVCAGRMTLPDAQQRMATDWYRLGRDLGTIR